MGRLALHSVRTIGTDVYDLLRQDILNLQRKPGEPIDSNQLAGELRVSRAPVRDALMRLRTEGLVHMLPQRGTYVSRISLQRVGEECFLRKSLELSVIPHFLKRSGPQAMAAFQKCIQEQKDALESGDYLWLQRCDDAFHGVLFLVANKAMCWNLIQSESGHYQRIRLLSLWQRDISSNVVDEHVAIMEAARQKDEAGLSLILRSHLSRLVDQERQLVEAYPHYFDDSAACL